MHKLEQSIQQQKIDNFISSISSKDPQLFSSQLKELKSIEQPRQEESKLKLRQTLMSKMPPQRIKKYYEIKEKIRQNNKVLEIISRGKMVLQKLTSYLKIEQNQLEDGHQFLLSAIEELINFQKLSALEFPDFDKIREQLYLQILNKINQFQEQFSNNYDSFKQCLEELQLPLKKGDSRKQIPSKRTRLKLISLLHKQSCVNTYKRQICSLLQKQDSFTSKLLQLFWESSIKVVIYLFTGGSQLHNLEEPGWMLQYMQLTLVSNYKYFYDFLLSNDLRQDVSHNLNNYFLQGSLQFLFYKVIDVRMKQDFKLLNPFLSFNFLDQVSGIQIKLQSAFGVRSNMLERLLLNFEGLLEKSFEYQNQRFEIKIFEDFININYSQVNLKNLEAYNLMLAFLNMLQSLHMKYRSMTHPSLKHQINKFYRARIMALVAHLKTSFDRIYHHSRLPKLQILVSFKRTEKQLRISLADMTISDSELEACLQKEYYCFLEQFYQAAALQALTPVHKKLHISLGDILDKFASPDESNHDQMFRGFSIIQKDWMNKMDQILKFSNYVDTKIRGIFFNYLQALNFSSVGLNLYLKIFEPFLQMIFQEQRHRTLISLITTEKGRYLQFMESHPQSLAFLNQDQKKKLNKFKESEMI